MSDIFQTRHYNEDGMWEPYRSESPSLGTVHDLVKPTAEKKKAKRRPIGFSPKRIKRK